MLRVSGTEPWFWADPTRLSAWTAGFVLLPRPPPRPPLFPYTTLFRSEYARKFRPGPGQTVGAHRWLRDTGQAARGVPPGDRKSTRLNSSHSQITYAVFCVKKTSTTTIHAPTDSATDYDPGLD